MSFGLRYTLISDYLSTCYKKNVPANAIKYRIGIPGANVTQIAMWFKKKLY